MVSLYAIITNTSYKAVENSFEGLMYSDFKKALGDVMVEYLAPFQQKYVEIIKDKEYLESILSQGAENAYYRAQKTLSKVYRKVGFIPRKLGS